MRYICPWGHITETIVPVTIEFEDAAIAAEYIPCQGTSWGAGRAMCDQRAIPEHNNTPEKVWD